MEGITELPEDLLYKEFGVKAEFLIDHAWGREPCTMEKNPIKVHPNNFYSTFCGSRMFLFSVSPLSRNL